MAGVMVVVHEADAYTSWSTWLRFTWSDSQNSQKTKQDFSYNFFKLLENLSI